MVEERANRREPFPTSQHLRIAITRRDKFPGGILCAQLSLAVVVFLSVSLKPQAQIRHSGNSESTRLSSCAETVLQKRVLLHPNMPFEELAPLCKNQPRDEFLAALKAHSVGVKEDDGWAYLLPASYFGPWPSHTMEGEKLHWKNIKVKVAISNADLKGGQTEEQLKPEVLQDLKEQVIKQARLVPVFEPHSQGDAETARVTWNLTAYVRHLRKGSPASVVIVVREGDDSSVDGRIIYGDQQPDGGYRLIWDSPVVVVRYLQLWFFDVDGDGIDEILLRSAYQMECMTWVAYPSLITRARSSPATCRAMCHRCTATPRPMAPARSWEEL